MWRHIDVQADWRSSWTYGRAQRSEYSLLPDQRKKKQMVFFFGLATYYIPAFGRALKVIDIS